MTQFSKYGKPVTIEVRAYAESLLAALDTDVDGWIVLDERVMNGQREKVALVSLRCQNITAESGVKIGERRTLELLGVELQPPRRYFVRMKVMHDDSDLWEKNRLWQDWKARKDSRGEEADGWLAEPSGWISAEKVKEAFMKELHDEKNMRRLVAELMEQDHE